MIKKPSQLKLKIAWFNNALGLTINQVSSDQSYALTRYYFWPKTEAWEQLKLELDSKFWLGKEEKIKILKTAGDIMNYWLSHRNAKTAVNLNEDFQEVEVVLLS